MSVIILSAASGQSNGEVRVRQHRSSRRGAAADEDRGPATVGPREGTQVGMGFRSRALLWIPLLLASGCGHTFVLKVPDAPSLPFVGEKPPPPPPAAPAAHSEA